MRKDELQRTRLSGEGSLERLNFSTNGKLIPEIERKGKEMFYSELNCV